LRSLIPVPLLRSEGVPVRQSQGDCEQQPSRHFLIVCRLRCGLMTARRVVSP
jgi:hypothetical protein